MAPLPTRRIHELPLPRLRPRHVSDVQRDGDLIVTVCDLAHEELDGLATGHATVHWSVPDPVPAGDPASFDTALAELDRRVRQFAPRVVAS